MFHGRKKFENGSGQSDCENYRVSEWVTMIGLILLYLECIALCSGFLG